VEIQAARKAASKKLADEHMTERSDRVVLAKAKRVK
jgi:hypothetical protein